MRECFILVLMLVLIQICLSFPSLKKELKRIENGLCLKNSDSDWTQNMPNDEVISIRKNLRHTHLETETEKQHSKSRMRRKRKLNRQSLSSHKKHSGLALWKQSF